MTGRASFLRRVRALEAAKREGAGQGEEADGRRALEGMEEAHLEQLGKALEAGRVGEGRTLRGPRAVAVLALPPTPTGPDLWARAYLLGEDLPPLPDGSPAHFGGRVWDLEEAAEDLPDGEEKTRQLDGAAVWAFLEALARVRLGRGEA